MPVNKRGQVLGIFKWSVSCIALSHFHWLHLACVLSLRFFFLVSHIKGIFIEGGEEATAPSQLHPVRPMLATSSCDTL